MNRCDVCLSLDRFSDEDDRWQLGMKADLTAEYSLEFVSSQLRVSIESGCATCSIVLSGLELISRNLSLFDASKPYRGRFILQSDSPLEVEIFDEEEDDSPSSACARIQFYTLPCAHSVFLYSTVVV
jgi:hypothetical protein